MRLLRFLLLLLILAALVSQAGRFLVINDPQKSDAIVVLAGETYFRPQRGLELLHQGMAEHMFDDVESGSRIFDQMLTDIAARYFQSLPESSRVSVCPFAGFSTEAEADGIRHCLESVNAHRVLIVTSEYHTRRALSTFRKRLPQYQFSVAAAHDPIHFGTSWWKHREWAKVTFEEWTKLIWWELVDRWR